MAKKKRTGPSPCQMKGRHLGRLGSGVTYEIDNVRWSPQGCECSERWRDFGFTKDQDSSRRVSAFMDKTTGAFTLQTDSLAALDPTKYLPVLPCDEVFRYPHSIGTKLYRKALGKKTKFRGCHGIEDKICDKEGVKHSETEVVGVFQDFALAQESLENDLDDEPHEQTIASEKNWDIREPRKTALAQERAWLLKDSLQSSWVASSENSSPAQPAWVEFLKTHFNELNLTFKQKSAAKHLLLENEDGLKIGEVATKLRISVDSLKDRINQIKKKIFVRFPEASDTATKKPKQKREKFECDLAFGGFYRKSLARKRAPVYSVNPYNLTQKLEIQIRPKQLLRRRDLSKSKRNWLAQKRINEKRVTYIPTHNGVFSSWIPMGAKRIKKKTILIDSSDFRRKLPRLSDYEG